MDNIMMIELTPEQAKQMVDGGLSGFIIPHDDKIEWEDGSVSLLHAQRPDAP